MFERVMKWLETPVDVLDDGFSDRDIRVSIAALFYHMIAIDGEVKQSEVDRLKTLLNDSFSLDEGQLELLVSEGKEIDESSAGLFPFTVILNRQLSKLERHRVYSQLQALAMADGTVHPLEQQLLNHTKVMLKLNSDLDKT